MRLLVLATDYPRLNGAKSLYYVHTRNLYYASKGVQVSVLNFAASQDYVIDGICVYSLRSYQTELADTQFDALILHAPNVRCHCRFLIRYHRRFPLLIFVFHGHEVLRCSEVYPKPYAFDQQSSWSRRVARDLYDTGKLALWRHMLRRLAAKSYFIFVSEWMYDQFIKYVRIETKAIRDRKSVIHNAVGKRFETESYDPRHHKEYDFVTIRSNLDGSKYCIDVVADLARSYPEYRFCVVGRGRYFKHNSIPPNITLIDRVLSPEEITALLNQARFMLLPTKTDAQGVMACEAATFGIPLITSDIPVCREVLGGFGNVTFADNRTLRTDLRSIMSAVAPCCDKNRRFFAESTSGAELSLFCRLTGETPQ